MECKTNHNGEDLSNDELEKKLNTKKNLPNFLKAIKKKAKNLKLFQPEDASKDPFYKLDNSEQRFLRVSDTKKGALSLFRRNIKERQMSSAEVQTARLWGAVLKDGKWTFPKFGENEVLKTDDEGEQTFYEYLALKNKYAVQGTVKGNLFHKIMEVALTQNSQEREQARAEVIGTINSPVNKIPKIVYEWLWDSKKHEPRKVVQLIAARMGLNIFESDAIKNDEVLMETKVYNEILGWAGTVDLISQDSDGFLSVFDFKAGKSLLSKYTEEIMRYGEQLKLITDNQLDRAKLQTVIYSLMIKLDNPDAKFRKLAIAHIPNEFRATQKNMLKDIEVASFINMIEMYLKNEEKDKYKALQASMTKEQFQSTFNPQTYQAHYSKVTVDDMRTTGYNPSEQAAWLKLKIAELSRMTANDSLFVKGSKDLDDDMDAKKLLSNARKDMFKYIKQLKELEANGVEDYFSDDMGLSIMSKWFGNMYDTTDPYLKIITKDLQTASLEAEKEYQQYYSVFMSYLKPVWENYQKEKGLKIPLSGDLFNFTKYGDLYKGIIVDVKSESGTLERKEIAHKEEDLMKLDKDRRELALYLNEHFKAFLGDKNSFLLKKDIEVLKNDKIVKLSNLDIQNGEGSGVNLQDRGTFEYYKGFLPKFPKTGEEIRNYKMGVFTKEFWQEIWKRHMTNYYEDVFEHWNNVDEVIPIKGLGTPSLESNAEHTLDLNEAFSRFTRAAINKKHLDPVYGMARATKIYLEVKQDNEINDKMHQPAVDYIEKMILDYNILGKDQQHFEFGGQVLTRGALQIRNKGRRRKVSWVKVIKSLKSFTSASVMWLKAGSGTANGVFATMITYKKAIKDSTLARFTDWGTQVKDFGPKDLAAGQAQWVEMQKELLQNKAHESKTYQLLKRLNYLPDMNPYRDDRRHMLGTRNKLLSQDTFYMFHALPEQMLSTAIMVAQLRTMKVDYKGEQRSLWSMYDMVKTNVNGREEWKLEWARDPQDGKKPFVRGVKKVGQEGSVGYADITELSQEETAHMKYVYQRIHGGYRRDEHTMLEYYVLGSLFTQFRRYLPSILKNFGMSKGARSLGYYKTIDENTPDGKPIMEWNARIIEGRFPLLAKSLMAWIGVSNMMGLRNTGFGQWVNTKFNNMEEYRWDSLSAGQKDIIADFYITFGTFALMFLGYLHLFKDSDDDDFSKKMAERIGKDYIQQYNVFDMIRMVNQPSVAAKNTAKFATNLSKFLVYGAAYGVTGDQDILTNRGRIPGATGVATSTPVLSGIRNITQMINNNMNPDLLFTFENTSRTR